MSYDFDIEYMNECMEPFALSCPDDEEYITKFEEICRIYHQTVDNIVDEVVSIMQNQKSKMVNFQTIESLEAKLEAKLTKEAATPKAKKPVRKPLADRTLTTISKDVDDVSEKVEQMDVTQVSNSKLIGKYAQFSPFPESPANEAFLKRAKAGQCLTSLRGSKYLEVDTSTSISHNAPVRVKVVSALPRTFYGDDKASKVIDVKMSRFEEFASRFREAYAEISEWGNPRIPSAESVFTYGQVIHEDSNDSEKFSEFTTCLMLDDEECTMLRVDFSKHQDDVTLFPGQIVVVSGTNETGDCLMIDKIFAAPKLPVTKIANDVQLNIWMASGPFTSSENCGYEQLCELLDHAAKEQPEVLILTGPFVDKKNNYIMDSDFCLPYDLLLEQLFAKIVEKLESTKIQVIIQPCSNRDMTSLPVFPSSPFDNVGKPFFAKNVHFVADPAVVQIGECGLEIAITSSDVVVHLSKVEYHRSSEQENSDRIARLASHLLSQRSLYPLEPVQIPSSLGDILAVCKLSKSAPHLFVTPCVLAPFAKAVDASAFVNPSTLAKGSSGSYIKMSTNFSSAAVKTENFNVLQHSLVEIYKI